MVILTLLSLYLYYSQSLLSFSSWRITSKLHDVFQTLVGLILGVSFGLVLFSWESEAYPFVGYFLASPHQNHAALLVRSVVTIVGSLVIFSKELKALRGRVAKSNSQ
jgi:hypothetical protein